MMEIYILDEDFYETDVIDSYESFIWTERFDSLGDFELVMHPNEDLRMKLVPGTMLSIKESKRTMVVEKIHEKPVGEGRVKTTYTGVSLEKVLYQRVVALSRIPTMKSVLYEAVDTAILFGYYDQNDMVPGLEIGYNKLYPASTIPPNMDPAPVERRQWFRIGEAHEDAAKLSPLGFRIVREPGSRKLYYDNYTGNDRSAPGKFDISDTTLAWPNPNMFEARNSVRVWTNRAKNPGFTENMKNLGLLTRIRDAGEYEYSSERVRGSIIDSSTSKSGKALELTVTKDGLLGSDGTYALASHLDQSLEGLYGKQFTVSITIEIKEVHTGSLNYYARGLTLRTGTSDNPAKVTRLNLKAPNTVGVHHLTGTFTFPDPGTDTTYHFRLHNGSTTEGDSVIFSDLVLVELPSNPIGYFDGEYSPDPDLVALGPTSDGDWGESYLVGNAIPGISTTNCVVVQSKQYGVGGVSARMIRNTATSEDHYATLTLDSPAKKLLLTRYQPGPFPSVLTNFGRVELREGATLRATSAAKNNNVTEDQVTMDLSSGVADNVIIRGGYTQLGGSLWFDQVIATADPDWAFEPNEQVLFAEDLDSFIVSESLESIANYYNVAMVTHPSRNSAVIVDDGYSGKGIMRRVLHVDASDLDEGRALLQQMADLGRKALGEHRRSVLLDGTVPSYSRYVYDRDYHLGDVVMVKNRAGKRMVARVEEQIFVNDLEGFRTYPTLREESSILLGTWFSPEYNIFWDNALNEWADQP